MFCMTISLFHVHPSTDHQPPVTDWTKLTKHQHRRWLWHWYWNSIERDRVRGIGGGSYMKTYTWFLIHLFVYRSLVVDYGDGHKMDCLTLMWRSPAISQVKLIWCRRLFLLFYSSYSAFSLRLALMPICTIVAAAAANNWSTVIDKTTGNSSIHSFIKTKTTTECDYETEETGKCGSLF